MENNFCPICGKPLKYRTKSKTFAKTCGNKQCIITLRKINTEKTCLIKYGTKYAFQSEQVKQHIKETNIIKYGVEISSKSDIVKQHAKENCIKKYGVICAALSDEMIKHQQQIYAKFSEEKKKKINAKRKQTCLSYYGVDNTFKLNKCITNSHSIDTINKQINSKRKNNSFNKSKPEDECYELLKEKYPDIIRQYRDERYPFNCDFYIPSKDLFIEYQGSQYHQGHPFDINNDNDIDILNKLKEKANNSTRHIINKASQYDSIIYVWTVRDVRKRNIAKENKLNYIEIWPQDNYINIIDNYITKIKNESNNN